MYLFLFIVLFSLNISVCFAQTDTSDSLSKSPVPITGTPQPINTLPLEGELNNVKFNGNIYFSSSALQDVVSSLPSDLSFAHRIFRFYYRQISINPYTPKPLEDALGVAVRNYEEEYRYFDQTGAENDVLTLIDVYNQYGFHDATASYSYDFDSTEKANVLTFSVKENNQYTIDTIIYTGFDNLPVELREDLFALVPSTKGTYFNEPSIKNTIDALTNYLQNNGYYFVHFDQPIVFKSPLTYSDSIIIPFLLGKRCKIGKIFVKSDFREQNPISDYLIRQMLDIHEGDWYNRAAVGRSQSNLYSLSTFDLVSIDSLEILQSGEYTILPLQIYLQYKKQKEIVAAPFINHTTYDNFTNFGVEISLLHRNLFGAAQTVSLYGRHVWQDFSLFSSIAREWQVGGQFSQPLLFEIGSARIGFSLQSSYSYRFLSSGLDIQEIPLRLTSFPLRVSFPVNFPSYTFVNSILFEFFTELQQLHNFEEVSINILTNAVTQDQQKAATQFLIPFAPIHTYAGSNLAHPGQILSATLTSDTRNNPFSPSKGHFLSSVFEFAYGRLYSFRRLQLTYYHFFHTGSNNVLAIKFRTGNIWIDLSNSYFIPFDRHFFAGGANSVRSYSSRSLADLTSSEIPVDGSNNLLGNATIIEGSLEYRYRFARPRGINSTLADQIQEMGITFFIDWGNAFNQLQEGKYASARLNDLIGGLAVGIGAGFRRETPVGPIRIDVATRLYDPTSHDNKFITSRSPFSSENLQIHIGLGHAF
ncbi:MAG: BamA/TamA family outer membrane protein [Ignavibacteria bacterium]|nr:BamA/TamA family outer membrane protein [Ignavibacteria bacterium]